MKYSVSVQGRSWVICLNRITGKPPNRTSMCYIIDFTVHVSSYFLKSTLHCSCFISFPSVHTSLFMFHLCILQSTVHFIHFTYHSPTRSYLPYLFVFTLHGHSTLIVSFNFQPIPSLEINYLRVFLDKFWILDRYSLLEAELRWFYYSISFYIKQEIQHGVRRNVLVCSAADVYLLIYSTQAYVGKR